MKGYGQYCPVARATEILGKRWTLLILRDLHGGCRHFNELRKGVPLIFPSTLGIRNAASDLSTLPATPRSKDGHPIAFLDTHAWRSRSTWPEVPIVLTIRPE